MISQKVINFLWLSAHSVSYIVSHCNRAVSNDLLFRHNTYYLIWSNVAQPYNDHHPDIYLSSDYQRCQRICPYMSLSSPITLVLADMSSRTSCDAWPSPSICLSISCIATPGIYLHSLDSYLCLWMLSDSCHVTAASTQWPTLWFDRCIEGRLVQDGL